MKIYAIDFEKIIKNYKPYIEQSQELEKYKIDHYTEMDSMKKEMENIISTSKSGLVIDDATKQGYMDKFKSLQSSALNKENSFRSLYGEKQSEIMDSCFNGISAIVDKYASDSGIDMVINKAQIIFNSKNSDITDTIIDLIKDQKLYTE